MKILYTEGIFLPFEQTNDKPGYTQQSATGLVVDVRRYTQYLAPFTDANESQTRSDGPLGRTVDRQLNSLALWMVASCAPS